MNERIKLLRKQLNLTQQEFAGKIGMKRNSIALIESGRSTSDQTILAICREFGVNEEWLRNGTGEMFISAPDDELEALARKYDMTPIEKLFLEKYFRLSREERNAVSDFIAKLADSARAIDTSESGAIDLASLTIDQKVALYRQELEREEKAAAESKALRDDA